jgi:hypothetical protein
MTSSHPLFDTADEEREVKRRGAARHANGVERARARGGTVLELLHPRTLVTQPERTASCAAIASSSVRYGFAMVSICHHFPS